MSQMNLQIKTLATAGRLVDAKAMQNMKQKLLAARAHSLAPMARVKQDANKTTVEGSQSAKPIVVGKDEIHKIEAERKKAAEALRVTDQMVEQQKQKMEDLKEKTAVEL